MKTPNLIHLLIIALCFLLFFSACSQPIEPPLFNSQQAFDYLAKQVEFGPRVPGSPAAAECREFFKNHFAQLDCAYDSQSFIFDDPYSNQPFQMINLIASFEGEHPDQQGILLLAHYDSRPRTDYAVDPQKRGLPIDGANDGASGVAVLMEMGNLFNQKKPPVNVDLVFVDGEDWGKSGDVQYYLLGSREFVRQPIRDKYRFGLVIDMVGDKDQTILIDSISQILYPELNELIFSTAKELGLTTFKNETRNPIIDDHVSLNSIGLKAITIIDFDYPHWHTEFDTVDKCSPESLGNVGRLLAEIIYNRYRL